MDSINKAFLGKRLKRDLFNSHGVFIAPARTVLNEEQLAIIDKHGIQLDSLYIQEETRSSNVQSRMDTSAAYVRELFDKARYTKQVPLLEIREEIIPIIQQVVSGTTDIHELFASLQSKDDYTYRHNVAVGVLSTLIGRWLGMPESELAQLTLAATLHDIGKLKIPHDLLVKPDRLTTEEFELVKKHTIFGYEMIKETVGATHMQAVVALQHHERQDGSGYPLALRGDQIAPLSRIVAIADIFHAMTSERPYRKAAPFYHTLQEMNTHTFGELEPHVCRIFIDRMMQSTLSHEVVLTDGRRGTIILIHRHDPLRPLISIDDVFIDLSKDSTLKIVSVAPKKH